MTRLFGIFPAVLTPFKEDLSVDYETWKRYLEFLSKKGIGGLFLFGTNGEGVLLSTDEKKELLKIAVDVINGCVPILVQVGGLNLEDIRELVEFSKNLGVDGIVALAHFYYKLDDVSLLEYFKTISDISKPLPFFVYNIPRYTGNPVSVKILRKLKDSSENFVGIKDSERSMENLLKYKTLFGKDFIVMTGTDSLIVSSAVMGMDGVVSALADSLPEICVDAFQAGVEEDMERAKALQEDILKIRDVTKSFSDSRSVLKYILVRRGIFENFKVRFPLRELSVQDVKKLDFELKAFKILLSE